MPKKASDSKTTLLSVRVTPRIKEIVIRIAHNEGMDASEYLRGLIADELRRRGALPAAPGLDEESVTDVREVV